MQRRSIIGILLLLACAGASGAEAQTRSKRRVLSITYDPILSDGRRLTDHQGWNDVPTIRAQYMSVLESRSGWDYEIYRALVVNAFPRKVDGFRYSEAEYLACLANSTQCHNPDTLDYAYVLDVYDACELFNGGLIDEVFLFGGPYFGYWESTLAGPSHQAYWYNSNPIAGTSCDALLPIMGFSYHVGVANMLHNFGHRSESTMTRVFGSWNNWLRHDWDRFALNPNGYPGYSFSGCGNTHYPPNTASEYVYWDTTPRPSYCDEFWDYPAVNINEHRSISCHDWGCTELGYYSWWLDHIPDNPATQPFGEHSWDWWRYLLEPNYILWEEAGGRGRPRVPYAREYWVVDSRATLSEVQQIAAQGFSSRVTIGFSYDDAGIGDLGVRKVVVWGDEHDRDALRNWYAQHYGGVSIEFRAIPGRGTWRFGPYATTSPAAGRGRPRVQYARTYWVVDSRATLSQLQSILARGYTDRRTVGFSYDDAGIGDLDVRNVVVWGNEHPQVELRAWYHDHYPGVNLTFTPLP